MERELAAIDRGLALQRAMPLRTAVGAGLAGRQLPVLLMTSFGALALLLASVGVYAMFASIAAARSWEFGLRMALGSRPRAIAGLVLRQGAGWMAIGLAGGAVGVALVVRLLRGLLYEVAPFDPIALGAAVRSSSAARRWRCSFPSAARRASIPSRRCGLNRGGAAMRFSFDEGAVNAKPELLVDASGRTIGLTDVQHDGRYRGVQGVSDDGAGGARGKPAAPAIAARVDVADRADAKGRREEMCARDRHEIRALPDAAERPLRQHRRPVERRLFTALARVREQGRDRRRMRHVQRRHIVCSGRMKDAALTLMRHIGLGSVAVYVGGRASSASGSTCSETVGASSSAHTRDRAAGSPVAKRIGGMKPRYSRTSVSMSGGVYHEQYGRRSGARSPMA